MFANSQDYLNAVSILIKSNKNLENRLKVMKDEVLPTLRRPHHMLDVGIGCGAFTREILPFFKKATLIEPEKKILKAFEYSGKIEIKKIVAPVENADLPSSVYDLIVMSHVLYHIPEPKRFDVIKKLYNATTEKGMLVIVYEDSPDRQALTTNFGSSYFNSSRILDFCKNNFLSVEVSSFEDKVNYDCLQDMRDVCRVYLNDAYLTVKQNELDHWIKQNLAQSNDDKFQMKATQYSIKIRKIN